MARSSVVTAAATLTLSGLMLVPAMAFSEEVVLPTRAWVTVRSASVYARPDWASPIIGHVEQTHEVLLSQCVPTCRDQDGWGLLSPHGALPLKSLVLDAPAAVHEERPFEYGKVLAAGASIHRQPSTTSAVIARRKAGDVLAFDRGGRTARGWLEWKGGGYVQTSRVRTFKPNPLTGEHSPLLPLAFVVRDALASAQEGTATQVQRYSRAPLLGLPTKDSVELPAGVLSRRVVRIAWPMARPASIPATARWVHVDPVEQVLTAYEGDTPVMSTLVSTGKTGFETRQGTFRAWLKVRHTRMHGQREPYDVEEVPYVLFFHGSEALHGQFWHSNYGSAVSHGCVNLSLEDAAWLFDWAPPALPAGWHSVLPGEAGIESLWVVVRPARPTVVRTAGEKADVVASLPRDD